MSSIIELSDLAVDRRGKAFAPHPEASKWQPERITAGPPVPVTYHGQRVYVPLRSSYEVLEEAIGYAAGWYRLRQVREDLTVIDDAPCAYVEVQGVDLGTTSQRVGVQEAMGLAAQAIHANEKKDELLADMVKSMLTTQVQLQMGTVKVLDAVGSIIPVASGIQAIERPAPIIDVDEMATMLLEAMEEQREGQDDGADNDNSAQDAKSWVATILQHPFTRLFGQHFMGLAMEKYMELQKRANATKSASNNND